MNSVIGWLVMLLGFTSCSSWRDLTKPRMYGVPYQDYQGKDDEKQVGETQAGEGDVNLDPKQNKPQEPLVPRKLMYGVPYRQFDLDAGRIDPVPPVEPEK